MGFVYWLTDCKVEHTNWFLIKICVGSCPHVIVVMIGHIESYLLCTAGLSFLRSSEKGFCAVKPVQSGYEPKLVTAVLLQLKQELESMQRAQVSKATPSSWSAVTPDDGGIPALPPPRSRSPSRKSQIGRGPNSHQMERVRDGPPPETTTLPDLPAWPFASYDSCEDWGPCSKRGCAGSLSSRSWSKPKHRSQILRGGCIHNSSTSRFSVGATAARTGSCEGRSGWGAELWTQWQYCWRVVMPVTSSRYLMYGRLRQGGKIFGQTVLSVALPKRCRSHHHRWGGASGLCSGWRRINVLKRRTRLLMDTAKAETYLCPLALRGAAEHRFREQLASLGVRLPRLIPFGSQGMARCKRWHHVRNKDVWQHPMQKVTIYGPADDMSPTSNGYYVECALKSCDSTTFTWTSCWTNTGPGFKQSQSQIFLQFLTKLNLAMRSSTCSRLKRARYWAMRWRLNLVKPM